MKNKHLANKVKTLRQSKGFSQEKLAENSGLSLRTIQRVENAESYPTGETLKRITQTLNINPEDLIDWTTEENKSYLKMFNLSALFFILFPILGIVIPLVMWISRKDKIKNVKEIGIAIINFQITWTILLIVVTTLNYVFFKEFLDSQNIIDPQYFIKIRHLGLIAPIFMYIGNCIYIILNTFKIDQEKKVYYYPKINFIKN